MRASAEAGADLFSFNGTQIDLFRESKWKPWIPAGPRGSPSRSYRSARPSGRARQGDLPVAQGATAKSSFPIVIAGRAATRSVARRHDRSARWSLIACAGALAICSSLNEKVDRSDAVPGQAPAWYSFAPARRYFARHVPMPATASAPLPGDGAHGGAIARADTLRHVSKSGHGKRPVIVCSVANDRRKA